MSSVVEKMKETLHLGRHSKEQHEGQAPPKHTTTAQPPPVHTTQSEGDVHVMRQHMIGGGTASATGAGIGTQDAAGHVEKDRGYPAGISAAPAKHSHEPIAPTHEATKPPEVPPGPAGEVGYGTAGEGVAAVEDAEETQDSVQQRGPVCDQKFISTFEERPVEKEIVQTILEHHPIEKKFVVETRPLAEHEIKEEVRVETLGVREQVIAAAQASSPCEGGPALMTQADLASAGGTTPGGNPGSKGAATPAAPPPTPAHGVKQSEIIRPRA